MRSVSSRKEAHTSSGRDGRIWVDNPRYCSGSNIAFNPFFYVLTFPIYLPCGLLKKEGTSFKNVYVSCHHHSTARGEGLFPSPPLSRDVGRRRRQLLSYALPPPCPFILPLTVRVTFARGIRTRRWRREREICLLVLLREEKNGGGDGYQGGEEGGAVPREVRGSLATWLVLG